MIPIRFYSPHPLHGFILHLECFRSEAVCLPISVEFAHSLIFHDFCTFTTQINSFFLVWFAVIYGSGSLFYFDNRPDFLCCSCVKNRPGAETATPGTHLKRAAAHLVESKALSAMSRISSGIVTQPECDVDMIVPSIRVNVLFHPSLGQVDCFEKFSCWCIYRH